MTKYWKKRLELFGPDKAFLPMTLGGLFSDSQLGLQAGLSTVLPHDIVKDPDERSVILYDPSRQDNSSRESRLAMVKALWYCIHAALLDNEITQRKGMIGLVCPRNAGLREFDPRVDKLVMESVQGILPIRISCVVVCHPPAVFGFVWSIVQLFLTDHIRKRVQIFRGTDDQVVQQLHARLCGFDTQDDTRTDWG